MPRLVTLEKQGNLMKAIVEGFEKKPNRQPSKRGKVFGLSERSRKRMLEQVARLEFDQDEGYRQCAVFITLTTLAINHPKRAKDMLFAFIKRMKRRFPDVCGLWRMEFQKRGAPHFHLILFNLLFWSKEEVQGNWGEIVNEERPFTRIESIRSAKGVMKYTAKYCGKMDEDSGFNYVPYLAAEDSIGRVWGVINRDKLPVGKLIKYQLDFGRWFIYLKRLANTHWNGVDLENIFGFTLFLDKPDEFMTAAILMASNGELWR